MKKQGFTLVELMVTIAILAILAVVAVPSFLKYQRRAKTSEAIEQVDKILKGAALYYATPYVNSEGIKMECQFPASQGATPVENNCCASQGGPDADDDDRCDPDAELWQTATWKALYFEMRDSHYFVYSFTSSGEGDAANFKATAQGDLDCDLEMSTFQRRAFGNVDTTGECRFSTDSAFFVLNETE